MLALAQNRAIALTYASYFIPHLLIAVALVIVIRAFPNTASILLRSILFAKLLHLKVPFHRTAIIIHLVQNDSIQYRQPIYCLSISLYR